MKNLDIAMFENSALVSANREFTVNEISLKIKEILEGNFGLVKVRGEVSGLKIATSGHVYFNLKDNNNVIACTCWRPVFSKLNLKIEDGFEVIVNGKISAYSAQSKYQISVDMIEHAGIGAMIKLYEERKARLAGEGLFDVKFKKRIKLFPLRIGIITSLSGAVIKDMIHRITDRCPLNIIVWPATVQGNSAAAEIITAIEAFNNLTLDKRPCTLIIARGGGSIEDLWSFNDELLARAVFASKIPIISAVGHETDYTLIDFVADLRAPTPTAAAEFATPVLAGLKCMLNTHYQHLLTLIRQLIKFKQSRIEGYKRILDNPLQSLYQPEQRIDELGFYLKSSPLNLLKFKQNRLNSFNIFGNAPKKLIDIKFLKLKYIEESLSNSVKYKKIEYLSSKLEILSRLLLSLDYNNVLKRGFVIVKAQGNKIISTADKAKEVDNFNIKFIDGEVLVKKI